MSGRIALKVCVAGDDGLYRRTLEITLAGWGYEVVCASDGEQAWSILQGDDAPDMAILDWLMPGLDGPEVCRRVRARTQGKYLYLLLLTAQDGIEDMVSGLEAGEDDYFGKPFKARELKARLTVGTRVLALQNELIASREAMRVQATHDALTGVWNRRAILDILNCELHRSNREHRPIAILLSDLDYFKGINDRFGHLAGDAVLVQAAQRLAGATRPYDKVGRYGGEEFVIVLPDCDMPGALCCGERLRERLAREPVLHGSDAIAVT